jgi:hypothetical protein
MRARDDYGPTPSRDRHGPRGGYYEDDYPPERPRGGYYEDQYYPPEGLRGGYYEDQYHPEGPRGGYYEDGYSPRGPRGGFYEDDYPPERPRGGYYEDEYSRGRRDYDDYSHYSEQRERGPYGYPSSRHAPSGCSRPSRSGDPLRSDASMHSRSSHHSLASAAYRRPPPPPPPTRQVRPGAYAVSHSRPGAYAISGDDDQYHAKIRSFSRRDVCSGSRGVAEDPYEAKVRQFSDDPAVARAAVRPPAAPVDRSSGEKDDVMVEIFPGVTSRLRGTQETLQAVANDFYTPVSCFACNEDVFCVADVSYVICPGCKVVSPLDADDKVFDGQPIERHGLGLGFTVESLFQMQSDVFQKQALPPMNQPRHQHRENLSSRY